MANYCVNRNNENPNGDHEVHKEGCVWWPNPENRIDLGEHSSCHSAVVLAKPYYANADGCATCSPDCHNS
jgi:hypothetical protein